ncbi:hypothetical protein B0O80DRAFT_502030 [Mortierella sp. GBAus27b]|nr:hypothetical protein B0O80DRAFT_502030 [Mortierella sp. GBAus27b]
MAKALINPPKSTVHVIVQRPLPVHAPIPSQALTPLPSSLSDGSRPGTPLSGDLHTDIKKITDKSFAAGPITTCLDAFVKGCGKTRAVIEPLSQYWGFYFSASNDDWGSDDMTTVRSAVQRFLNDKQESSVVDREANNSYARKATLLLFLSRLIFKHCLSVPGSNGSFTSASFSTFDTTLRAIFGISCAACTSKQKDASSSMDASSRINSSTRLLVVHDEAQVLGDEFSGSFQSTTSAVSAPTIITTFARTSRYRPTPAYVGHLWHWVVNQYPFLGSEFRMDLQGVDHHVHFPGTGLFARRAVKAGFGRISLAGGTGDALPKISGALSSGNSCSGKDCRMLRPGAWKKTIEGAEDRLVAWAHRHIKGNLCYEISRLHDKHNKHKDQLVESIDSMLGLLMYQRCIFGNHDIVLEEVDPQLVEHAFGRIKIIQGHAVTVMDEPFVSKAVENYFAATDPYFVREVRRRVVKSSPIEQGCVFERFMMKVFSETLNTRPLSNWPHQPLISDMCPALVGKVEIVGWREPELEQGTTHGMMSMGEFMDVHVNHQSTRNNMPSPNRRSQTWRSSFARENISSS